MINYYDYDMERSLESAVLQLIRQTLNSPYSLHMIEQGTSRSTIKSGFHYHESWELFCALRGEFNFEVLGQDSRTFPENSLIIVPPGCMHMNLLRLKQPVDQFLLTFNLPGNLSELGILRIRTGAGKKSRALSTVEVQAWEDKLKGTPEEIMREIASALRKKDWEKERALALFHLLFATFMGIIAMKETEKPSRHHVREALALLEQYYYDCDLDVSTIARQVGLSSSHLSSLFRKETGKSLYQTLLSLRIRRATELLLRTSYSIKEIAALTGWRNQLYFSAACKRIHGKSPLKIRQGSANYLV